MPSLALLAQNFGQAWWNWTKPCLTVRQRADTTATLGSVPTVGQFSEVKLPRNSPGKCLVGEVVLLGAVQSHAGTLPSIRPWGTCALELALSRPPRTRSQHSLVMLGLLVSFVGP